MTLQSWFELECGDGNDHGSWAIERDETSEKPFLVHHHFLHGRGKDYATRQPLPDREKGAEKRIKAIMARYPGFAAFIQTDPRGAPLYILRPTDIIPGGDLSTYYNRGVAVYK